MFISSCEKCNSPLYTEDYTTICFACKLEGVARPDFTIELIKYKCKQEIEVLKGRIEMQFERASLYLIRLDEEQPNKEYIERRIAIIDDINKSILEIEKKLNIYMSV